MDIKVNVFWGVSHEWLATFLFGLLGRKSWQVNTNGGSFGIFSGGSGEFFASGSIN